jgi:hypothetical protein
MPTKNEILADLLIHEALKDDRADSKDIEQVKRELEDTAFLAEIAKITSAPPVYNPFSFEFLLSDTAELARNCLDRRTELKTLEVTLLNETVNRIMNLKKREYDGKVKKAENEFPESDKVLTKQFKLKNSSTSSEADPKSVAQVSKFEGAIKEATDKLKEFQIGLEDQLTEFAKDKNSGLNYLARYIETKKIYWEDVKELAKKMRTIEVGLKTVYSIDSRLSKIEDKNLLNGYYVWLKENLLKFNQLLEKEIEYTMTISLKAGVPHSYTEDGLDLLFRPKGSSLTTLLKEGKVEFHPNRYYTPSYFFGKKHRIRSIGAAVLLTKEAKSRMFCESYWNILLIPPKMKDSLGKEYQLPDIPLYVPSSQDSRHDNQVNTPTCFNVSPFGWWTIRLSQFCTMKFIRATDVHDVLLFIKVAITDQIDETNT